MRLLSFVLLMPIFLFLEAQEIGEATLKGLQFRNVGPGVFSGRITDLAVQPDKPHIYYVATASGNAWKTVNAGVTWTPIFDDKASYSIGCMTIDPNNPHVVWLGTGENNSQRSVAYGDGVYKSPDGGKSWQHMGLKQSEHIAKIIVDPRNSQTVWVASQGPLWGPGGDRGLYRSDDGGKTWQGSLQISENTGVTDVVMDPRDPDVLYAATYQRRRHVWVLLNGGPESAIYKTIDGGENWEKLSRGLPGGDVGRIGLAISPVNPDLVFAWVEAAEGGGVYMSTNRGASWIKRNAHMARSPQYYMEIFTDPVNPGRLYALDTWTHMSQDSGRTWKRLGNHKRHVDDHALWIDPHNNEHLRIGGDGGIYESWDLGKHWDFVENIPIVQYYRVAVDNAEPFYNVYGGTQDNNSMVGPSRTTKAIGIANSDWYVTNGGDGFKSQIDPKDPNIVYAQAQYGWLVRYNRQTTQQMGIKPISASGEALRWNWDSPLIISPHNHQRLYFAANKLFRSDDRGNSWTAVSPDLTAQIDRNRLPVMDRVWSVDAVSKNKSTSFYGTLVALSESRLEEGLLYVGSDDGLIQVSQDGGQNWRREEDFRGVPKRTYVSHVEASRHDADVVYATFDNHKMADFKPYVRKSNDRGQSWENITGNLPQRGSVYVLREDPLHPEVLFVGTEFGVFVTLNGGRHWTQLKGGIPTISIRDLEIQEREGDLVLASFGRNFFILDDYTSLREIHQNARVMEAPAHIFPIRDSWLFVESRHGPGSQGSNFYTAPNPPFGATFTYHLRDTLRTRKAKRQAEEKKLIDANKPVYYPSWDDLRAEDDEKAPYLVFEIRDADSNVVRRIESKPKNGLQRITWDLRFPAYQPLTAKSKAADERSYLALPGDYTVSLWQVVAGEATQLTEATPFTVKALGQDKLPYADLEALVAMQTELRQLRQTALGAQASVKQVKDLLPVWHKTLRNTIGETAPLAEQLDQFRTRVHSFERRLNGDATVSRRSEPTPPGILARLNQVVWDQWRTTEAPTVTQQQSIAIATAELEPLLVELQQMLDVDIPAFNRELDALQAPWTPGRIPRLK
jgi:photosystem II stability/assembly factor-like uncharacterized protein